MADRVRKKAIITYMEQLQLTPQLKLARISTPNLKTYLLNSIIYIPNKRMI